METKDWIYSIGIGLTFLIGVANFLLSKKNRANAIREHLYKEQIIVYRLLIKKIHEAVVLVLKINSDNVYNTEKQLAFTTLLLDIETIITEERIILSDSLLKKLNVLSNQLDSIDEYYMLNKKPTDVKTFNILLNNYAEVFDEVRNSMGVDYLGIENKKLLAK